MTKDVKKYLKRMERYLKKNDVDMEYNSAGALTFITETMEGNNYRVVVNGEDEIVWLTTLLTIERTADEVEYLKAINELTGTKNPVAVHVERKLNVLMLTMCFNAEMITRDIDAVMSTWWSNSEIALNHVLRRTGAEIDWEKSAE